MVMAGTKTQTRRIADLERLSVDLPVEVRSDLWDDMPVSQRRVAKKGRHRVGMNQHGAVFAKLDVGSVFGLKPGEFHFRCPLVDGTTHLANHGNDKMIWTVTPVGEQRLWVRETWSKDALTVYPCPPIWYRSDIGSYDDPAGGEHTRHCDATRTGRPQADCFACAGPFRWRPSIRMLRRDSRTNLTPIQARLMRLQDITDEDAIAEGVTFTDYGKHEHQISADGGKTWGVTLTQRAGWSYGPSQRHEQCLSSPRMAFGAYWNHLHGGPNWNLKPGPSPWDTNPWVWAYTFRKEA
jgi:hypothetical protein